MDEYERLEEELSAQYALYVQSWRNLSYLENELDVINAQEQEKIAENDRQLKHMQKRLREEELRILRGQAQVDEKALDDALLAGNDGRKQYKRPGAASTRRDGRHSPDDAMGGGDQLDGDSSMYGSMAPMGEEEDSGEEDDEGEEEEEDEDDEDGQVEFNQEEDDDLDDLDDDDDDLDDGEEDDDEGEDNEF